MTGNRSFLGKEGGEEAGERDVWQVKGGSQGKLPLEVLQLLREEGGGHLARTGVIRQGNMYWL